MRRRLAFVLLLLLAQPSAVLALPAFARRFNLSCGACHTAPPRLNAFGEAFHENGFKPPGTMRTPLPGTLFFWPPGGTLERGEVTVPMVDRLIDRLLHRKMTTAHRTQLVNFAALGANPNQQIPPSTIASRALDG